MSVNNDEYYKGAQAFFSSNVMLREIVEYDNTIELIGYIDEIKDVAVVGMQRKRVLRFFVNTIGQRVQMKVWEYQIDRVMPFLECNRIIHFDGVGSRTSKGTFNEGTIPFEFVVQSNTEFNILGEMELKKKEEKVAPLITFSEISTATDDFKIQGFVKTLFNKVNHERSKTFLYTAGAITDGTFKLEIRVKQDDGDLSSLKKCEKIEVTGKINFEGTIFLDVESTSNITKIAGEVMSSKMVLRACQLIKRPSNGNALESSKKMKLD